MLGKRFEKEFNMIKEALESEKADKEFRLYTKPYLESVVDKYIEEHNTIKTSREILIKAAWTHFDTAMKKYFGRAKLMLEKKNELYYFNTYFNWYIRQAIIEYLKTFK